MSHQKAGICHFCDVEEAVVEEAVEPPPGPLEPPPVPPEPLAGSPGHALVVLGVVLVVLVVVLMVLVVVLEVLEGLEGSGRLVGTISTEFHPNPSPW